jgi:N-acetyl-beta-hexosaminidase
MKKYFLERVSNITHSYGVNLAGWEDGFIEGNGIRKVS